MRVNPRNFTSSVQLVRALAHTLSQPPFDQINVNPFINFLDSNSVDLYINEIVVNIRAPTNQNNPYIMTRPFPIRGLKGPMTLVTKCESFEELQILLYEFLYPYDGQINKEVLKTKYQILKEVASQYLEVATTLPLELSCYDTGNIVFKVGRRIYRIKKLQSQSPFTLYKLKRCLPGVEFQYISFSSPINNLAEIFDYLKRGS